MSSHVQKKASADMIHAVLATEALYARRICLSINFEREVTDSRPSIFSERVPATVLLFELNSALRVTRDAGTNMQTLIAIQTTREKHKN